MYPLVFRHIHTTKPNGTVIVRESLNANSPTHKLDRQVFWDKKNKKEDT